MSRRKKTKPLPDLRESYYAELLDAFLQWEGNNTGFGVRYQELAQMFPVTLPQYLLGVQALSVSINGLSGASMRRYVVRSPHDFLRDLTKRRRTPEWRTVYIPRVREAFQMSTVRRVLEHMPRFGT